MTPKRQVESNQQLEAEGSFDFGAAIAIGMSLGLVFGLILNNIGMGISTGLLLATLANAYQERKQGKKGANSAFAITVGALLLLILVWFVTAFGWI